MKHCRRNSEDTFEVESQKGMEGGERALLGEQPVGGV